MLFLTCCLGLGVLVYVSWFVLAVKVVCFGLFAGLVGVVIFVIFALCLFIDCCAGRIVVSCYCLWCYGLCLFDLVGCVMMFCGWWYGLGWAGYYLNACGCCGLVFGVLVVCVDLFSF